MDGLALLCTLYGDGPVTLRRLREAGWDTVDRIESLAPETLSQDIGLPFEQARRLQREARGLLERVGGFQEDPLPSMQDADEDSASDAFRLDAVESSVAVEVPMAQAPSEAPAETTGEALVRATDDDARGVLIPHRPEPPAPLEPDVVDGLDPAAVAALAQAGVRTLDELKDADDLELARESGLPLTRVLRLRFLARRLESAPRARVAEVEAPARFSPAEYGASEGVLEEPPSGGPFA